MKSRIEFWLKLVFVLLCVVGAAYAIAMYEPVRVAVALSIDEEVQLETDEGGIYVISIAQNEDGYMIRVDHPAHNLEDGVLEFVDDNSFEMSWTMHVGEIYLQRHQFSWRILYPSNWVIVNDD